MQIFLLASLALASASSNPAQTITLTANTSLTWTLQPLPNTTPELYGLGLPLFNGKAFGLPLTDGFVFWRRISDALVVPVAASSLELDASGAAATLSGSALLPGNVTGSVALRLSLEASAPSASLALSFSVSQPLTGWNLCIKFSHDGVQLPWRASAYPIAGNSSIVNAGTLHYMGWPGVWLTRPDASLAAFFSLSLGDDFSNPLKWTGSTGFQMQSSEDGVGASVAPQFWLAGGALAPGEVYEAGLRLMLSDAGAVTGDTLAAVREIAPALLRLENYAVEPMPPLRAPGDILACFCNARRITSMWHSTPDGSAYQLQDIAEFIYLGTTPESAYFEYQLYLDTGDELWRNRTFEQMAFWLKGQNTNASSRHYGAVHTTYTLPSGPFNSQDRGANRRGWKPDVVAHMVRYALLTWEAVSTHEPDTDVSAWRRAAALGADWVMRMAAAQAGAMPAGSAGFPQMIAFENDLPSPSVASGRTMNALPVMVRVLGSDAPQLAALEVAAQGYLVSAIEKDLFFSGQHPDLIWNDLEQDSVWELVEYWLDVAAKGGEGGTADSSAAALQRAVGDAYVALMMLCPKQLSWVDNPTQMAADEQQFYHQYTTYTYHNRKWLCLQRLAEATGEELWTQLADRLLQLNAFTQVTKGTAQDLGGIHEAIADPWLARGGGFNFMGSVYLNELALDLALQLRLSGVFPTEGYTQCVTPDTPSK